MEDTSSTLQKEANKYSDKDSIINIELQSDPHDSQTNAQNGSPTPANDEEKCILPYIRLSLRSFILILLWLAAAATLLFYIITTAQALTTSLSNPVTTQQFEYHNFKVLPAVTICNWNTIGTPPEGNVEPCDFCDVTFIHCLNASYDCDPSIYPTKVKYNAHNQTFTCYDFNNNSTQPPFLVYGTGYGGSISLKFEVLIPGPLVSGARIGLQATFHSQQEIPDVYNEPNYCFAGADTFYTIQEVQTIFLNKSSATTYQVHPSSLQLTAYDISPNTSIATITITFGYLSLTTQVISETITYGVAQFLGDFAGMAGLLMGLDTIKFFRGILALTKAVPRRTIKPFIQVFNP